MTCKDAWNRPPICLLYHVSLGYWTNQDSSNMSLLPSLSCSLDYILTILHSLSQKPSSQASYWRDYLKTVNFSPVLIASTTFQISIYSPPKWPPLTMRFTAPTQVLRRQLHHPRNPPRLSDLQHWLVLCALPRTPFSLTLHVKWLQVFQANFSCFKN